MRSGEAKKLEWSKVDVHDWVVRLSRKMRRPNGRGHWLWVGELREIIERRLTKRIPECPYVFHRDGKRIKSFRRAFKTAFKNAGLEGSVPHDMRRSGVRNFTKAGLGESEGMAISGHKTNSVYKRYNIIDEEVEQRKVVPIRQAG